MHLLLLELYSLSRLSLADMQNTLEVSISWTILEEFCIADVY